MRVLLLEDDDRLRGQVSKGLRAHDAAVDEARTLAEADELTFVNDYDLVVLDRTVPDGDGLDLVREMRARHETTPVLILTALDSVADRVTGLDAGADDYLAKPFAMDELLARVRALSRRPHAVEPPVLRLADLVMDPAGLTVQRGGRTLTMTSKERSILVYLVTNTGRVVSREDLLEHCWDAFADPSSNVIEVRIRLLREKLGLPPLIHTVRGAGYVAEERRAP